MKTLEDAKKSANLKRSDLNLHFKKVYDEWKGNFTDDRELFCRIYEMLFEALNVMETVQNNYIWVAFNHEFGKDYTILSEIYDYFINQRTPALPGANAADGRSQARENAEWQKYLDN